VLAALLQKQTRYRSKGKDKLVPVHALKTFVVAEVEPPLTLNLGARCRWVV